MHIFILRESICPGPMKLGRQLVIGIVITFSKSSLSLGIKRETAVTNICLKCITFINLTFRMLQHTSSEVIIRGGLGWPWRSEDAFHSAPVNLTLIS